MCSSLYGTRCTLSKGTFICIGRYFYEKVTKIYLDTILFLIEIKIKLDLLNLKKLIHQMIKLYIILMLKMIQ